MKNFYITTPIFYPSGDPHIGHAFTTIMADVLARAKKMLGYNVFFLTGTDEHGQKIADNAKKSQLDVMQYINQNVAKFKQLWTLLDINYDYFIRTTDQNHIEFVQQVFAKLKEENFIYKANWQGYYCVSCEENIPSYLMKIIDQKKYCEFLHELVIKDETSYFLKVKQFKQWIKNTILANSNNNFIIPNYRINEIINSFLDNDFADLSITRSKLDWGIEVLDDSKHKIYVWFDALLNYISVFHNHNIQDFWQQDCEIVHLLSKEIIRFHCIYWPIILHMLNKPLPSTFLCHGWIITNSGKMSKSLGNVIDPYALLEKVDADSLRYYLMKNINISQDSKFSYSELINTHNADLCNNFGNIINRSLGLIAKYHNNIIPVFEQTNSEFMNDITRSLTLYKQAINELNVNKMVDVISDLFAKINKFINISEPWIMHKNNEIEKLDNFLAQLFNAIRFLVFYLKPFLTKSYQKALALLNFKDINHFDELLNFNEIDNTTVNPAQILFVKINQ